MKVKTVTNVFANKNIIKKVKELYAIMMSLIYIHPISIIHGMETIDKNPDGDKIMRQIRATARTS